MKINQTNFDYTALTSDTSSLLSATHPAFVNELLGVKSDLLCQVAKQSVESEEQLFRTIQFEIENGLIYTSSMVMTNTLLPC